MPSPKQLLDKVTGPSRRSVAARLFTGDLDLAAYSGNWDMTRRRPVHTRACLYCYRTYHCAHFVEDEWHVFFICPLYQALRSSLPLRVHEVLVEGHEIQGEGCTPQNLQSLVRALMQVPHFSSVVD